MHQWLTLSIPAPVHSKRKKELWHVFLWHRSQWFIHSLFMICSSLLHSLCLFMELPVWNTRKVSWCSSVTWPWHLLVKSSLLVDRMRVVLRYKHTASFGHSIQWLFFIQPKYMTSQIQWQSVAPASSQETPVGSSERLFATEFVMSYTGAGWKRAAGHCVRVSYKVQCGGNFSETTCSPMIIYRG